MYLVFSFSQIYQIIIIWNNKRNIFHHHSQNQAKEKRPFKTSLPLRQSNAHPSQQNAPVRLICARTGPILSQIYRPIKLMFKKSVQTPFKIKMQFNSIKLFARFVFLGWLFNFISNLLLFNQTDYVLLYTVFTHFVLPPLLFAKCLYEFFSFSLSLSDKLLLSISECTKLTILSIALSTVLLLIFDLYPNAFITHIFTSSNISGDLIAAFIRSAISFAPLSCDSDKMSRKISANVIYLFSIIFKLQTFQQFYHFIDGS